MKLLESDIEGMTGFEFELLESDLKPIGIVDGENLYEVNKEQLAELFFRVREVTWFNAREQFIGRI